MCEAFVSEKTAVSAVTDLAARRGCDLRGTDGTKIELRCEDGAVPDLLQTLADIDDVTGYEVTEPGLDSVFEALAGADESELGDASGARTTAEADV